MIFKKLKYGDVIWGSRKFTGKDYGIGNNDAPFIVIDQDGVDTRALVGLKKIADDIPESNYICINIQYTDYYFDVNMIQTIRPEFLDRPAGVLTDEQKNQIIVKYVKIIKDKTDKKLKSDTNSHTSQTYEYTDNIVPTSVPNLFPENNDGFVREKIPYVEK